MRSQKDFFLGLGLGLIFAASVWMVASLGPVDDAKIITKAKELGMIFPKDLGEPQPIVASTDINYEPDEEISNKDNSGITPTKPVKLLSFTIKPGTSAKAVANDLGKAGIIDDADHFVDELTKMQLTDKIKAKSYSFDLTHGPLDIYLVIREITK